MHKLSSFLCSLVVLAALFSSCSKKNDSSVVTSVKLNANTAILAVGGTYQLTATVLPANAINKTVTWTSSNTDIVTVDQNGNITGVAEGTATVTAKAGNITATCAVTVNANFISVTDVKLDTANLNLGITQTYQLTATISPDNATNKIVLYSSSNTQVATVDDNGKITAVAVGTAVITATTQDGAKTATCNVTVNELTTIGLAVVSSATETILVSSDGALSVDWGDGSTDTYSSSTSNQRMYHEYADNTKQYTIKIMTPRLTKLVFSSGRDWGTLDVSQNKSLHYLDVTYSQLTSLDVRVNTALDTLWATYMSKLASINVTGLTQLNNLRVSGGFGDGYQLITSVDLSTNTNLQNLELTQTSIVNLDLTGVPSVTSINVGNNALLQTMNLKNLKNLTSFTGDAIPNIQSVDFSGCSALTSLTIGGVSYEPPISLASVNLTGCTSLTTLICNYNANLTSLDVSTCTALKQLTAKNNPALSSLKVGSNQTNLTMLKIIYDNFAQADLESLFSALPNVTSGSGAATLDIYSNPGTAAAVVPATVAANGWTVDYTTSY